MSTISKVKTVQGDGSWENNYGTFYKFEYTFEDGTVLAASHKTVDGNYKPGEEVEYEVKGENDHGKYGKVSKPQQQSGGGGNRGGDKYKKDVEGSKEIEKLKYPSFSASYAKDIEIAFINQGKDFDPERMYKNAGHFLKWLKQNS